MAVEMSGVLSKEAHDCAVAAGRDMSLALVQILIGVPGCCVQKTHVGEIRADTHH